jgi:hypothetical protein
VRWLAGIEDWFQHGQIHQEFHRIAPSNFLASGVLAGVYHGHGFGKGSRMILEGWELFYLMKTKWKMLADLYLLMQVSSVWHPNSFQNG